MGTGPIQVVEAPAPARRPFGLETVAQIIPDNGRWLNGVNARRFPAGPGNIIPAIGVDQCEPESPPRTIDTDRDPGVNADDPYLPFGVVRGMDCTGFAAIALPDFEARLRSTFEAVEWQDVEGEFFDGGGVGQASLRSTAIRVGTTSVPLVQALGELEQAFGDSEGVRGILHASDTAMTQLRNRQIVVDRNGRLETAIGTPCVVSAGYDGAEPGTDTAPAATEEYLYMSAAVNVRRTDVGYIGTTPAQIVNKETNLLEVRMVRWYSITWDHDAVRARLANLHT